MKILFLLLALPLVAARSVFPVDVEDSTKEKGNLNREFGRDEAEANALLQERYQHLRRLNLDTYMSLAPTPAPTKDEKKKKKLIVGLSVTGGLVAIGAILKIILHAITGGLLFKDAGKDGDDGGLFGGGNGGGDNGSRSSRDSGDGNGNGNGGGCHWCFW